MRKPTRRAPLAAKPASCPVTYPPAPFPCKVPKVGQTVTVYSTGVAGWQSDIGAGWRFLVVIKVGRTWVTLFHVSTLSTVKWSLKDWIFYMPRPYEADPVALLRILTRNVESGVKHGFQFSVINAKLTETILGELVVP